MSFLKRYVPTFLLILLILLLPASFVSAYRNAVLQVVRPVGSYLVRQSVNLGNFRQSIAQIPKLRQDNSGLQQEVLTLRQQLAETDSVSQENQTLRKELGVTGVTRAIPKSLAHIVLLGNDPLDRTASIDLGSNQGVKEGQPAVSQGFLVGRVIAVRPTSAVIRFVTSQNSRIQVWDSQTQEKGLLEGDGNIVYLTDVTQGAKIASTDTVETSGLGGSLPQGILIGEIGSTVSHKSDLSQKFTVKLAQDPSSLETLFILQTDPK